MRFTYRDSGIHKDVSSDETVPNVGGLLRHRFLGEQDCSVDKERLAEGERSEESTMWNRFKD